MKELLIQDDKINWKAILAFSLAEMIFKFADSFDSLRFFTENNLMNSFRTTLLKHGLYIFLTLLIWGFALKLFQTRKDYFRKIVLSGLFIGLGLSCFHFFWIIIKVDTLPTEASSFLIIFCGSLVIGIVAVALSELLSNYIKNTIILFYLCFSFISILLDNWIFPQLASDSSISFLLNKIPLLTMNLVVKGLIVLFIMKALKVDYVFVKTEPTIKDEIKVKIREGIDRNEFKEKLYDQLVAEYPDIPSHYIAKSFVRTAYGSDEERIKIWNRILIGILFFNFLFYYDYFPYLSLITDTFSTIYLFSFLAIYAISIFKLIILIGLLLYNRNAYIILGLVAFFGLSLQLFYLSKGYGFELTSFAGYLVTMAICYKILNALYPNYIPFYMKKDQEGNFII